jgi:hypothetical protein
VGEETSDGIETESVDMTTENTSVTVHPYLTWFKVHERLVLFLATGFFAVYLFGAGLNYFIKHDQTQAQIAQIQAKSASDKVTTDAVVNQALLTQLAQIQQQNAITNQRIDSLMSQRAQQTKVQKQQDDQASSAELAARIQTLLAVGTVKVETQPAPLPDTLQLSLDAAHADADKLEDGAQAQADVLDLNTKLTACNTLTGKQTDVIQGLNTQISDGGTALKTEQASHAADVKTLTAKAKRSWLRGFKWGIITGFVGGLFAAHAL